MTVKELARRRAQLTKKVARSNLRSSPSDGKQPPKRSERAAKGREPTGVSLEPRKPSKRGTNARSLANLRPWAKGESGFDGQTRPTAPVLSSPAQATAYVALRASGVPPAEAVVYFAVGNEKLTPKQWNEAGTNWETHALVKAAWDVFNGGEWQTLEEEQRLEVSLRQHLAQCAYLLYTSDINHPMAPMSKINYAKSTILAKIAVDKQGGTSDSFTDFLKQLMENSKASAPATWTEVESEHGGSSAGQESLADFGEGDGDRPRYKPTKH